MANDLTVLKGTLSDRANALGSYLGELKADLGRDDRSFRDALDVCAAYTRAFVKQLDHDWDEAVDRDQYRMTLRASLESFLEREHWIDKRFARSRQGGVPRALRSIARRQFQLLEIDGYEPVLTVGPPDSFEAQLASLSEFLFEDCYVQLDRADDLIRTRGPNLSIFCAPYIEGTRVLWYPIVIGHEIAHIRLERGAERGAHESLVAGWLGELDLNYGTFLDAEASRAADAARIRIELNQQVLKWAAELICDLNAVRLFGPAGLSAIAEFLSILESQEKTGLLDPRSHPPLPIRLRVLFRFLDQMGWDQDSLPEFTRVWKAQGAEQERPPLDPRSEYVADLLGADERVQSLIDFVRGWGETSYELGERAATIAAVADELLDGVPGATHVPGSGSAWNGVDVADVVNATWEARQLLDDRESGDGSGRSGALIDSGMEAHRKRLRLDSLASKAIDTLELSRLWGPERGTIAPPQIPSRETLSPAAAAAGAVLSRDLMSTLLTSPDLGTEERLVVTPLFEDSIQDAAIDLRLGPDFIVFRHSSTTAFDPLSKGGQDPRTMQERVHKSWGERFVLHPGELVLASTLEYIVLPVNVAAQVLTRSSYGRLGLLTATAVQVQPGSRGCITLELVNHGETPITLSPAARVAQLMLWFVSNPCQVQSGKYFFPVGPEFSKVSEDPDGDSLRTLAGTAEEPVGSPAPDFLMRVEAPRQIAEHFLEVARAFGAKELADLGDPRLHSAGLPAAARTLSISDRQLGTAVERWHQGGNLAVRLEIGEEIVVRFDRDLPRGRVLVTDADRVRHEEFDMPPDSAADLAHLLRFWHRGAVHEDT